MILILIFIVYGDEPEPLIVLFLLATVSPAIEFHFYLDVQHLPFQVLQDLLEVLSSDIDTSAAIGAISANDERIGVALQPGNEVSAVFLLMRVNIRYL